MSKLEAIKKILEDRLVDKIDFSDMEDSFLDSIQRKFVKELESWQQEAEKIITDSGVILQGDIKPSLIKAWCTEKIKLPHWEGKKRIEYPSTAYEATYIQYSIEMLIVIKTIQKELELCENKEDRQRVIDLINLGKSLRMAEVAFYYPETIKEIISEKNQKIARKRKGKCGPLKQTIKMIGERQKKPTFKTILSELKRLSDSDQDNPQGPLYPIIIEGIDDGDDGSVKVDFYHRTGGQMKTITIKSISNMVSELFPFKKTTK